MVTLEQIVLPDGSSNYSLSESFDTPYRLDAFNLYDTIEITFDTRIETYIREKDRKPQKNEDIEELAERKMEEGIFLHIIGKDMHTLNPQAVLHLRIDEKKHILPCYFAPDGSSIYSTYHNYFKIDLNVLQELAFAKSIRFSYVKKSGERIFHDKEIDDFRAYAYVFYAGYFVGKNGTAKEKEEVQQEMPAVNEAIKNYKDNLKSRKDAETRRLLEEKKAKELMEEQLELEEKNLKKRLKEEGDRQAQLYAGLLSGPSGLFKKMSPAAPGMTQLFHEREGVTITHIKGKLSFLDTEKRQSLGYITLHALTPKGGKPQFFLGVTETYSDGHSKLHLSDERAMKITVNFESKTLNSVTSKAEHLNKGSKYAGVGFNFFQCPDDVLQNILQSNDNLVFSLSKSKSQNFQTVNMSIFFWKKEVTPSSWKTAYGVLTSQV